MPSRDTWGTTFKPEKILLSHFRNANLTNYKLYLLPSMQSFVYFFSAISAVLQHLLCFDVSEKLLLCLLSSLLNLNQKMRLIRIRQHDLRSEPELLRMSGIRLDEHVSLKFMWWYTQKQTLSRWSDLNRTMSYLYPSWQKKEKLTEHNSCNYFIPFGLVSRRCHYFDLLSSPLICEHFVMMTCNTILCTLQSSDKFAEIHSSLHNCVKTDPKF